MTGYHCPASIQEASDLLAAHEGEARIIAGGTDVLLDMAKGKHRPAHLVDITRIPELGRIDVDEAWVTVGAAVPFVALREHPYLAGRVHALGDAAASVGSLAIQTSATWVGNLIQAMPAADGAIIAIALDAEVLVVDRDGSKWCPAASLYTGPGRSVIDSTRQIVTHLRFPVPQERWGTGWQRTARRPSLVLPTLNCAAKLVFRPPAAADRAPAPAAVDLEPQKAPSRAGPGEVIASAAIAMGPVGPCPIRAGDAEAFLVGRAPSAEAFAEAAQLALCDADPRSSLLRGSREYRLAVLPVLIEEALALAAQRAKSIQGASS